MCKKRQKAAAEDAHDVSEKSTEYKLIECSSPEKKNCSKKDNQKFFKVETNRRRL